MCLEAVLSSPALNAPKQELWQRSRTWWNSVAGMCSQRDAFLSHAFFLTVFCTEHLWTYRQPYRAARHEHYTMPTHERNTGNVLFLCRLIKKLKDTKQAFYIMHTFSTSADKINKRRLSRHIVYCFSLVSHQYHPCRNKIC